MTGGTTLVTGASGFIGSAVVRRLTEAGRPVVATARGNLDALSQQLAVPVTMLDVMGDLPALDGVATVIHCATPNDIQSREGDAGLPLAVSGTRRLLAHAAEQGVRRVVFLSTLQVYGTELSGAITEDTPVRCENLYGLNHYLGEEVCRFYAETAGMDIVALRPSNVYGVPLVSTVDRWTLVPMCFVREAVETGAVTLRSSGRQRRNFVSTEEVAGVIADLIADFPPGFSIVNAASDWTASIAEIAAMVEQVWRRTRSDRIALRVLSDRPEHGNDFTVETRLATRRPTPAQSRRRMEETIEGLIELHRK